MGSADGNLQSSTLLLRVVIRSPDRATFVAKYSRFVKDDRIFIFTKSSQAPGTRVRFTLELADSSVLMSGEGTVTRTRPDVGDPGKPPGMELKFVPLDDESRVLVGELLLARAQSAGAPLETPAPSPLPPIPARAVIDSQEIDTKVREPAHREGEITDVDTSPGPPAPKRNLISASYNTPTPLPAPLPPPSNLTPAFGMPLLPLEPASGPVEPPPRRREETGGFPVVGPAPPFAEAWRAPLPPGEPGAPPERAPVPANPFSEVSDGAIEYFIEWSVEQSTAPKASGRTASYANVTMAPPRAERPGGGRMRLLGGVLVGLAAGVPLGGGAMWIWRAPAVEAPRSPADKPAAGKPSPTEKLDSAKPRVEKADTALPASEKTAPGKPVEKTAPDKPNVAKTDVANPAVDKAADKSAPVEKAGAPAEKIADGDKPAELPEPPALGDHRGHTATLRIRSTPSGCDVVVKGEPRGKTPLEVELPPNHRYDVEVMLPGGKPWHKRINLKPPRTEITASRVP